MITMNNAKDYLFVNIYGTASYFETHLTYTECGKEAKVKSVSSRSNAMNRWTVSIAGTADGTKFSLFLMFRAAVNGPIVNSLHQIMPQGMQGCTQVKRWMMQAQCYERERSRGVVEIYLWTFMR